MAQIHTFSLDLTMKLMNEISKVDRFDASWSPIEKRESQTLKQLKSIATVRSVGASTRIEGSKMTDAEVEVLLEKLKFSTLREKDEQEVAGYFEVLEAILQSYKDIEISEENIKNLHKRLLEYGEKEEGHRGNYRQESSTPQLFETTDSGSPVEQAMKKLLHWYHTDHETLPIVKTALFVYDFLSIRPFQNGNGRLSRLLGTLLLLKHGYSWIQYLSVEHEIENRKEAYHQVLMQTQKQRPGEPVDEWVILFLDILSRIQEQLMEKVTTKAYSTTQLAPKEKNILAFIENHPGSKSGEVAEKLNIPLPTVKKILATMINHKLLVKYGQGAGTNYMAEKISPLKADLNFKLTHINRKKEFLLMTPDSYVEIKKILLTTLFKWERPEEWSVRLHAQGLSFEIAVYTKSGDLFTSRSYMISQYVSPYHFQPVFHLNPFLNILSSVKAPNLSEYPIKIQVTIFSAITEIDFEAMFVYDEV